MRNTHEVIRKAYTAFNARDVDGALALMSDDVSWPKASEGGNIIGKEEVRAYWSRQWKEFDPRVEPMEIIDRERGRADVRVHQLVKSLSGEVLSDTEVVHVFIFADDLIVRMTLQEANTTSAATPSAAFLKH